MNIDDIADELGGISTNNGIRLLVEGHYEVLGIEPTASQDEVRRAYRLMAKEHHPDRNPGDVEAEDRFVEVSDAYEVLSNPSKRAAYDDVAYDEESIPVEEGPDPIVARMEKIQRFIPRMRNLTGEDLNGFRTWVIDDLDRADKLIQDLEGKYVPDRPFRPRGKWKVFTDDDNDDNKLMDDYEEPGESE